MRYFVTGEQQRKALLNALVLMQIVMMMDFKIDIEDNHGNEL